MEISLLWVSWGAASLRLAGRQAEVSGRITETRLVVHWT